MNLNKVVNLLDFSNIHDTALGIWWSRNNTYPSKIDVDPLSFERNDWEEFMKNNFDVIIKNSRSKENSKIEEKRYVCSLKSNSTIIIGWRVSSQSNEKKIDINEFEIYYDVNIHSKFCPKTFINSFSNIKKEREKKSSVYMVINRPHGLDLHPFEIETPLIDLEMNYGKDWKLKHDMLLDVLNGKKKKGIALLHGLPGTGKSMYIRKLISMISENRTVIYLPNQLINNITDPSFIPLMSEYAGSLLIIEDADDAIRSRKTGGGIVDKLLNLADGILSDFLEMQIICTFNNDISSIDDALLRKGRLILKHNFEKLSIESAQKLSNSLGFDTLINEEMTLAEIYNQGDQLNDVETKKPKIGFS